MRDLEHGIERDFSGQMSYGDYLMLDRLLSAQRPLSDPPQHDELLFIIQHQTTELWLKLLVHELRSARALLGSDELAPALKRLARVKHVQHTLSDQWSVLATLTPSEYDLIRPFLATSSGFQSAQYREVEFLLGNKNHDMVKVFSHDPEAHAALTTLLFQPSLYDEFLAYLARQGYAVPPECLDRDWSQPYVANPALVEMFAGVYAAPEQHWGVYESCEELVDVEDNFQLWRFRHLQVVQRTIGHKSGTGGSTGVDFLRRALDLKGVDRSILVTDAVAPAMCEPGPYMLGSVPVELRADDRVTLRGADRLAGSSLRMDRAIGNVMSRAGVGLAQAVTMASTNPARVGRVPGRLRALQPGSRADLVRFRFAAGRVEILETWLSGQRVY